MNVKTTNEVDNSSPQTVSMIPARVRIRVRLLSTIFRVSSIDISSSSAESSFVILIKALTPHAFRAPNTESKSQKDQLDVLELDQRRVAGSWFANARR